MFTESETEFVVWGERKRYAWLSLHFSVPNERHCCYLCRWASPSTLLVLCVYKFKKKNNLYRFSFTLTGSIGDKNSGDFTHALFVRFQRKEDLEMFYENPLFLKVLNEHVTPFCHVCPLTCKTPFLSLALSSRLLILLVLLYLDVSSLMLQGLTNVDYESEVEDDILSIFRKGEVWIISTALETKFLLLSNVKLCK